MPDTPPPLDLDAIVAAIAECRTYNFGMYQADRLAHEHAPALVAEVRRLREKIDVDHAMHEAFRPEVVAEVAVLVCDEMDWQAVADWCGGTVGSTQDPSGEYTSYLTIPGVGPAFEGMWIVQRHDLTFAIRATLDGPSAESVARLTARPAPAWDEEVVVEAVATALHGDGCPEDPDEGESCACSDYLREARIALAVVRDQQPVKPSREDIYRAWHGTDDPWGGCADSASIERVLDLLPGRSEAEVKAEALREAADGLERLDGENDLLRGLISINGGARAMREYTVETLRDRADRLAAEGGADRG